MNRSIPAMLAITLLACCVSVSADIVSANTVRADILADLEALRESENVPLLALTTFKAGKVDHLTVLGRGSIDTPLRWGSITKTFTALALSKVTRDNKIAWTQPVREIVADVPWDNPWADQSPVRVQDLAYLCAGMSDLSYDEFSDNVPKPLGRVLAQPRHVLWPPGLQHSYTNVTPGLSAWLVEKISGDTFDQYIAEQVFEPLGMPTASLKPVADLPGGYKADGTTEIPYWHMTFPAFGALNASLVEMTQAVDRILNSRLHTEDIQRLRSAGCVASSEAQLQIGYGAGHYGRIRQGQIWYGHGGDADGYRSRYALLPEQGLGYIVLINTDNPALLRRIERRVEQYLVAGLKKTEPIAPDYANSIEQWVGDYYPGTARFGVEKWQTGKARKILVRKKGRHLFVRSRSRERNRETELIPVGDDLFRRPQDPIATVRFFERDDAIYMQGELGSYFKLDRCPEWYCE